MDLRCVLAVQDSCAHFQLTKSNAGFGSTGDILDIYIVTSLEECILACTHTVGCSQFVLEPPTSALPDQSCHVGVMSNNSKPESGAVLYQLVQVHAGWVGLYR